ncbi:unnamed protein product [Soboliphyme baturini]|uniref:Uncharacterized protein n=1 Tax=Soboliphyme baturini TaxID=241478 RepID=A0A183IUU3_9BILA|nr:unnamed protein product [Soboliphyme baturini]
MVERCPDEETPTVEQRTNIVERGGARGGGGGGGGGGDGAHRFVSRRFTAATERHRLYSTVLRDKKSSARRCDSLGLLESTRLLEVAQSVRPSVTASVAEVVTACGAIDRSTGDRLHRLRRRRQLFKVCEPRSSSSAGLAITPSPFTAAG